MQATEIRKFMTELIKTAFSFEGQYLPSKHQSGQVLHANSHRR